MNESSETAAADDPSMAAGPPREVPGPGGYSRRRGLLALHTAVLLVSTSSLFGKWIGVNPIVMVFGRLVFAVPVLGWAVLRRPKSYSLPSGRTRTLILVNGAILAVHWVSFFHSVQISTVAVAVLGYSAAPVFAVLLEPVWFRERLSLVGLGAAGLIAGGSALIVEHWSLGDTILQGMFWGLIAGLLFAVMQLINRGLLPRLGSVRLAFHVDTVAFIVLIPIVPFAWEWPSTGDIGLMAIQGALFTVISHTLFIYALHSIQAQVVAMVGMLEAIYAILLAAWLLGEIPGTRTLAGGAVILLAVAWVTWNQMRGRNSNGTGQSR